VSPELIPKPSKDKNPWSRAPVPYREEKISEQYKISDLIYIKVTGSCRLDNEVVSFT
jgi:hypothetical protein